jgi:hypothetical protein
MYIQNQLWWPNWHNTNNLTDLAEGTNNPKSSWSGISAHIYVKVKPSNRACIQPIRQVNSCVDLCINLSDWLHCLCCSVDKLVCHRLHINILALTQPKWPKDQIHEKLHFVTHHHAHDWMWWQIPYINILDKWPNEQISMASWPTTCNCYGQTHTS